MKPPLGVILAGGQGTRMGGADKALLTLGRRPLLAHVMDRLAPQVDGLAVNANGDPARFDAFGVTVLPDPVAGFPGPLAGVLAGLDWAAAQGSETIVTVAADTPFFPCDLVPNLLRASEGMPHPLALAATPREGEETRSMTRKAIRHPTFGLWPVALREDLRHAIKAGVKKVVLWSEPHGAQLAMFPDPVAFFNVNTPEDLARAEAML